MTADKIQNNVRCAVCGSEFVEAEIRESGAKECPNCHTVVPFVFIQHDGYFKLNWQDLRLLAIYSQRWAMRFDQKNPVNVQYIKALENVIAQISLYQPKGAKDLNPAQPEKSGTVDKPILSPYCSIL